MDIRQVEQYVVERIGKELPEAFSYHSLRHTQDVVIAAVEFGSAEGVGAEEREWLQAAAWFHDLGYVAGCSQDHELRSAEIAGARLKSWGWGYTAVHRVGEMILATRLPYRPQNLLESILCDADIEYLGRPEMFPASLRLRAELAALGRTFDELAWLDFEIRFLGQIQFFTKSCRRARKEGLRLNCARLERQRKLIMANGRETE